MWRAPERPRRRSPRITSACLSTAWMHDGADAELQEFAAALSVSAVSGDQKAGTQRGARADTSDALRDDGARVWTSPRASYRLRSDLPAQRTAARRADHRVWRG